MAAPAFRSNAYVFAPTMLETTLHVPRYVVYQSEWHFGKEVDGGHRQHGEGDDR
jgi:hypothetical protein